MRPVSLIRPPCHHCGEPTSSHDLHAADSLRDEVVALLRLGAQGHACKGCVDRAERELDTAAEQLALDTAAEQLGADPAFESVCNARRDGWIEAMELDAAATRAPETKLLPAAVLRALGELADHYAHRHLAAAAREGADLHALAWGAALAVADHDWDSTMERAAARSFCHALLAGDLDRASRCAIWIYAPGEAFRQARAEVHAQRVANDRAAASVMGAAS